MSEAHLAAPWYVTGKLGEAEARELEEFAKEDPEFALMLEEAKHEAQADIALNESLGKPSAGVWERIERSIESERREAAASGRAGFIHAIKNTVSDFFAGFSAPRWQAVAAAAVSVCVVQAGAIVYLAQTKEPAKFGTASGPHINPAVKPAFIVTFSPQATIGEVNSLLEDIGASIVSGPNADMIYHISLSDDKVEKKSAAYQKLRASPAVKRVLPER